MDDVDLSKGSTLWCERRTNGSRNAILILFLTCTSSVLYVRCDNR